MESKKFNFSASNLRRAHTAVSEARRAETSRKIEPDPALPDTSADSAELARLKLEVEEKDKMIAAYEKVFAAQEQIFADILKALENDKETKESILAKIKAALN